MYKFFRCLFLGHELDLDQTIRHYYIDDLGNKHYTGTVEALCTKCNKFINMY